MLFNHNLFYDSPFNMSNLGNNLGLIMTFTFVYVYV
jgi:hypothetical protein